MENGVENDGDDDDWMDFRFDCNEDTDCSCLPPLGQLKGVDGTTNKPTESDSATVTSSKIQLDDWIEKLESENDASSKRELVHSLAGYVNVAYPILKSLRSGQLPRSESTKIQTRELQNSIGRTVNNLRRFSDTMSQVQKVLCSTTTSSTSDEAATKELLRRRSTRLVKNCELLNVLINIINSSGKAADNASSSSKANLIFGSSIALD